MTKLYYTDPLKAAWMAREHGVIITPALTPNDINRNVVDDVEIIRTKYPFYLIHPDSLPIFEPQDGDKDEDGYIWNEKRKRWVNPLIMIDWESGARCEHTRETSHISKRQGKAFFMPEVGDD